MDIKLESPVDFYAEKPRYMYERTMKHQTPSHTSLSWRFAQIQCHVLYQGTVDIQLHNQHAKNKNSKMTNSG